jgi:hypothetical protein
LRRNEELEKIQHSGVQKSNSSEAKHEKEQENVQEGTLIFE